MADTDTNAARRVYRVLTSTRIAVVLILVISCLALAATLVPQHNPEQWYAERYPAALHAVIHALGFEAFFRSALFLVPVALFTVNLGACAVDRLVSRARRRAEPRFGPDLVHVGLLVLVVAGLASGLWREETAITLSAGGTAAVDATRSIVLDSFRTLRWPDGRIKAWISTVNVMHNGTPEITAYPIEVNHPLRLPGVKLYQMSYGYAGTLSLEDAAGKPVNPPPEPGDYFEQGGARWVFEDLQPGTPPSVTWERYEGSAPAVTLTMHPGDTVGPFTIRGIEVREVTVLSVVHDPGAAPFLAAAALIAAGLVLSFVQKRGDAPA